MSITACEKATTSSVGAADTLGIDDSVLLKLLHQFKHIRFSDGRGQLIIRKVCRCGGKKTAAPVRSDAS